MTAYRAAKAAFVFKRGHNRTEYWNALPDLEAYFADIRRVSETPFDIRRAAITELNWWIVHRERSETEPEALSQALREAAGALYRVEPDSLTTYGDERTIAMKIRDHRQAAGGVSEADWEAIDRHLEVSWRGLKAKVAPQAR